MNFISIKGELGFGESEIRHSSFITLYVPLSVHKQALVRSYDCNKLCSKSSHYTSRLIVSLIDCFLH